MQIGISFVYTPLCALEYSDESECYIGPVWLLRSKYQQLVVHDVVTLFVQIIRIYFPTTKKTSNSVYSAATTLT